MIGKTIGAAMMVLGAPALAQQAPAAPATRQADGIELHRGATVMRVDALTDSILRVRIGRDGKLPEDASWAVLAAMRAGSVKVTPTADGFRTGALAVHIDPQTLALIVTDPADKVITADAADPISLDGTAFTLRKTLPVGEHIYGMGDKTGGSLDRRGNTYVDWNSDTPGFTSAIALSMYSRALV